MMDLEQFYKEQIQPLRKLSLTQSHPNFFIVGGMRCGTTSLWSYLRQHPQVYLSKKKEPIFFCTSHKSRQCIRDYKTYLSLFSNVSNEKAIGEASAAYLTSPESAELIHSTYPDAKIIISLRNPIEQAYSVYQWNIREGWEWLSTFEKALIAEKKRIVDVEFKRNVQYCCQYYYSSFGLYSEQLTRYFELYPKKNIKIVLFDEIKMNAVEVIKEMCDFLGVDSRFTFKPDIHNKGQLPLLFYGHYFVKNKMTEMLEQFHIPKPIRKRIIKKFIVINLFMGKLRSTKMKIKTRKYLLDCYKSDIIKTSKLIEKDLSLWLNIPE